MSPPVFHRLAALACLAGAVTLASAAPKAYVGNFKDDTVSVIDLDAGAVVATLPVAAGPHGMAITPDGRKVYVAGDGTSTLTVVDAAGDRVAGRVEVGKAPHGLAMHPGGKVLLVGVYGEDRIAWVDTATDGVVASLPVAKPHTIAIRPDGAVAYVASQQPGDFALVVVDVAARRVLRRLPLDKPPRDLEFGWDGRALYFTQAGVNAVQVLDPATDKVVGAIPTGVSPHLAAVYRGAPAGLALVQGSGELLLFDPASNAPGRLVTVGRQPHWMASYGSGRAVAVSNEGSDDVSLVDLTERSVRTVPVGHAPRKVVVRPDAAVGTSAAGADGAAGGARVSIADFAFRPAGLAVGAGGSVTWSNDDGAPHGLRFADAAAGAELLLPGQTFRRSFEQPGSYAYVCSVHPYMAGTVVVGRR